MPLSKLENFIKNTEGRILYVNPSDIDSTDSLDNQGNSLTKPFKTIQRAMLESARFSYVRGKDNDIIDHIFVFNRLNSAKRKHIATFLVRMRRFAYFCKLKRPPKRSSMIPS